MVSGRVLSRTNRQAMAGLYNIARMRSQMAGKKKKKKKRMPLFMTKLGGLVVAKGIRAWMSTLDYRAVFYDQFGRSDSRRRWAADLRLLAREYSPAAVSSWALQFGDAVEPASGRRDSGARGLPHGLRLRARLDVSRRGESNLGIVGAKSRSTSDDHARRAARAAAADWPRGRSIWRRGCNCRWW